MVKDEGPDMNLLAKELIAENLTHLNRKTLGALKKIILGKGLIALSLHYLHKSEVPV